MFNNGSPKSLEEAKNHAKKKTLKYRERDAAKRAEFIETIAAIPEEYLVYVDETGIDKYLYRPYARAARGKAVYGKVSGKRYKRTSIVAGQYQKRIVAPLQYSGTMDSALFLLWFVTMLLPCLAPGCVIIMDNARFHCKSKLIPAAHHAGCRILFLPPYSPDLNIIEFFWGWLKSRLRKILPSFHSLDAAITDCFNVK